MIDRELEKIRKAIPIQSPFLTEFEYTYPEKIANTFAPKIDFSPYITDTLKQATAIPPIIAANLRGVLEKLNQLNTQSALSWDDKLTRKYLNMQLGTLTGAIPSTYGYATGLGQLGLTTTRLPFDIFRDYAAGYATIPQAFIHPEYMKEVQKWTEGMFRPQLNLTQKPEAARSTTQQETTTTQRDVLKFRPLKEILEEMEKTYREYYRGGL